MVLIQLPHFQPPNKSSSCRSNSSPPPPNHRFYTCVCVCVYLEAVCVGPDRFLLQVAHEAVAEPGADEVGYPEHGDEESWGRRRE